MKLKNPPLARLDDGRLVAPLRQLESEFGASGICTGGGKQATRAVTVDIRQRGTSPVGATDSTSLSVTASANEG